MGLMGGNDGGKRHKANEKLKGVLDGLRAPKTRVQLQHVVESRGHHQEIVGGVSSFHGGCPR